MHYNKLKKIAEYKIKPIDFQILPAQIPIFSQIRTLQRYSTYAKLNDKENFRHKISLKRGFRFDHDNCYVNISVRPLFPHRNWRS